MSNPLRLLTLGRLAVEPAPGVVAGGPRPRRLALLAILAAAGEKGMSRDQVLAILWPESDEERGRHALSQTLYSLRRDLGREVILGTTELRLDWSQLGTDLDQLRSALAAGKWDRAIELYQGPFADGFHLNDDPGFGPWVDAERRHISVEVESALEAAATATQSQGDPALALRCWTRLSLADPLSGRYARGLMSALVALGDRAGALTHARTHTELVRRELDVEPDADVRELVEALRAGGSRADRPQAAQPAVRAPAPSPAPAAPEESGRKRSRLAIAGLATAVALGLIWVASRRSETPSRPVLSVGTLRDLATADSVQLSGVLGEMLSTSLARLTELEVVASTRILQLLPAEPDPSGRARTRAAQDAGASEILEGEITPVEGGLRLDLRRVSLSTGRVQRGYAVTAADRFALIDSATAAVARDLALIAPSRSVADVTTRSPIAYRLYEEGLRAFYQGEQQAASRLFRSALTEDSTFALAAYYAWRTAQDAARDSLALLALRLTDRAPDRERLLMRVQIAGNDPSVRTSAESLAVRYPTDPEALLRSAVVFSASLSLVSYTVGLLERVIAIDSASLPSSHRDLRLSEALQNLYALYQIHDSLAAIDRTLRRWIALQPNNGTPWSELSVQHELAGHYEEADRAAARYFALSVTPPDPVVDGIFRGILRGDPRRIRDACESGTLRALDRSRLAVHRWYCLLGYRHLGQFRAALAALNRPTDPPLGTDYYNQAILDFEMGRALLAAHSYQVMARTTPTPLWPGETARREAWLLTLSAMAYATAGDTVRTRALVDSIERAGQNSLYARDPRLHHFVRGLLLAYQRRPADALEEYRRAAFSWPMGFNRVNLEYARSALALSRPHDAVYPLQAALRGGIEGPQLYLTRTELHELLAHAFDAAGMADSAAAHYRYVDRMWEAADPPWRERQQAAARWLAARGFTR